MPSPYESYQAMSVAIADRVATVTFQRPAKLNAADALMHTELSTIFAALQVDASVDTIVLTGSGKAFSAGGDIEWMQSAIDDPASFEQTVREAKQVIFTLLDCEKPIVAKVNGHATGLGATIALFCDVIFAAEHAKIGDPHVSVALPRHAAVRPRAEASLAATVVRARHPGRARQIALVRPAHPARPSVVVLRAGHHERLDRPRLRQRHGLRRRHAFRQRRAEGPQSHGGDDYRLPVRHGRTRRIAGGQGCNSLPPAPRHLRVQRAGDAAAFPRLVDPLHGRSAAPRSAYLDAYEQRLREIEDVPALPSHPLADFGPDWRLKPGIEPRTAGHRRSKGHG